MGDIYLDNAATAPVYPGVVDVMVEALRNDFGNPSSNHAKGRQARELLEECRASVARFIGAQPDEIYFTSGATESNNLAIVGAALAQKHLHDRDTIITSTLEHASVTKTVRGLKREGWGAEYIDAVAGDLDLSHLEEALTTSGNSVALMSIMSVQNELGWRFPVDRIVDVRDSLAPGALVHTDAVQAFGKLDVDVNETRVDLMTFCSHKIGGPKGIGALYVRQGTTIYTTAFGGGQERGLRSGTQALPQIMGFTEAARIATARREQAFAQATTLKAQLIDGLRSRYADVIINSRDDGSPFIISFTIPHTSSSRVMNALSDGGVHISTASACASNHLTVPAGTWRDKHPLVLQLAGIPKSLATGTYRISLSDDTTSEDIETFLEVLAGVVPVR